MEQVQLLGANHLKNGRILDHSVPTPNIHIFLDVEISSSSSYLVSRNTKTFHPLPAFYLASNRTSVFISFKKKYATKFLSRTYYLILLRNNFRKTIFILISSEKNLIKGSEFLPIKTVGNFFEHVPGVKLRLLPRFWLLLISRLNLFVSRSNLMC